MRSAALKKISASFCVCLTLTLVACTSVGPKILPKDRHSYNLAVGNSNSRELLLNIVRLRYDDTPFFLVVTNISAGYRLERSGTATLAGKFAGGKGPEYDPSLSGNLLYRENPIINYVPLAGQKYAVQLLT